FFSSRRRHTRFSRDWSSDVCSSDLFFFPIVLILFPEYSETYCSSGDNSVLSSTNSSTITNSSRSSVATFGSVHTLASILQQFTQDRKSTRLNSSHVNISYAVFCLKK